MRHLLLTSLCAITVAAPTVFAQTSTATNNGSEYHWQTPAGVTEVTPLIQFAKGVQKPKGGGTDTKMDEMAIAVKGEYGINEMLSAGGVLSYGDAKTKTGAGSVKATGLGDIVLFVNGLMPISNGSLRFGADASFALADQEIKSDGDGNNSSGGHAITPFVGYEMACSPNGVGGARLSYEIGLGDRTQSDETSGAKVKSKLSGGTSTELDLFYEHKMDEMVTVGAALEIEGTSRTKVKSNGTTTNEAGATTVGLRVYVPVTMTSVTLLPQISYAQAVAMDKANYDSIHTWTAGVGARFAF